MENLFDVSGKVALVTGGTRGIGFMIAEGLVRAGAKVYVASRKEEAVNDAVRELREHGDVHGISVDLQTKEEVDRLAGAIADREDGLHILVNNAGATWGASVEEYPDHAWDKVLNLNVKAVFNLTRALLPSLQAVATEDDPARVVNIGSVDGLRVPMFENYAYSASKAAVHMLTRHLASAFASRNITVNAIAPGMFPSKMTAAILDQFLEEFLEQCPRGRLGEPEDIAGTVIYLTSRAGAYVTGAVLPVDGGVATLR